MGFYTEVELIKVPWVFTLGFYKGGELESPLFPIFYIEGELIKAPGVFK